MNGKQIACGLVMLSLLGCGREPEPYDDEDRDPPIYTYVVSTMHDPVAFGTRVVGFDLDDRVSEGATDACDDQPDQTSEYGPGIDNSFAQIERGAVFDPLYWTRTVEEAILDGEYLLLLEVSGVSSTADDASVGVRMYFASAGGPIAVEDGRIAPGQTFEQVGADIVDLAVGEASIEDGVLQFRSPTLPMPDRGMPLVLRGAHLRAHITPTGLTEGEIGGAVPLSDLELGDITLDEIRASGVLDLDPDPSDPTRCDAMSAGFTFEAVMALPN